MARTSVAMGNFDGLHLAHQEIVKCAVAGKQLGLVPTAVLFRTHPGEALAQDHKCIMTASERERALRDAGIEQFYYMDFSAVRDYEPEQFFAKILVEELGAGRVCCGFNYTFGKFAKGDTTLLKNLCDSAGVELCVTDSVDMLGTAISSTRIKELISTGDVELASKMLGKRFSYTATVVDGKHMGRSLGFPTINQPLDSSLVVPKFGVYASDVLVNGKRYRGATNIGVAPTLPGAGYCSETYIHDFTGDLYGQSVTVELKQFIRPELRFSSVDELTKQVEKDKATTALL